MDVQIESIHNMDVVDILLTFRKWLHPLFWVIKIVSAVFAEKSAVSSSPC